MRVVIDLTDGNPDPTADHLPKDSLITDDGDIVFRFDDTEIRMSYGQFDRIAKAIDRWNNTPCDDGDLARETP